MSLPSPTAAIRVGTASWSEPEFVKAGWYPKGLVAGQRLPFHAQRFDCVGLNSSFYAAMRPILEAPYLRFSLLGPLAE